MDLSMKHAEGKIIKLKFSVLASLRKGKRAYL